MNQNNTESDDIARTSEPVEVEWEGGLGDTQTVKVDPYAGKITINGRPFEIGALCSDDVPDWMYRSHPLVSDIDEQLDTEP